MSWPAEAAIRRPSSRVGRHEPGYPCLPEHFWGDGLGSSMFAFMAAPHEVLPPPGRGDVLDLLPLDGRDEISDRPGPDVGEHH